MAHDKSGFHCQIWSRPCHDQDTQEEGNQRRVGFLDIFSEEQDPALKYWTDGIDGIDLLFLESWNEDGGKLNVCATWW